MRASRLAALFVLAACDCGPQVQNVLPMLEIDTEDVDFGAVAVGDTVTQTVRLSAGTSADLTLAVDLQENEHGAYAIEPAPDTIPGSGSVTITIHFTPPAIDTYVATLDIVTNDPDTQRGHKRVLLQGQGLAPRVAVLPASLSLGAVACPPRASPPAACVDEDAVVVENVGEVTLSLGDVVLRGRDGAEKPENVRLTTLGVANSTLEPGQTARLAVRWQPSSEGNQLGDFEAELAIETNAPENRELVVPIALTGLPNSPPEVCLKVESVTRRRFIRRENPPGSGLFEIDVDPAFPVPATEYVDPLRPDAVLVRPGMTVSAAIDPACTQDPDEDVLSYAWSIAGGGLTVSPQGNPPLRARVSEILEPGTATVTVLVSDGVNAPVAKTLTIDAIPKDDLFVQVGWPDASAAGADLDLHLVLDSGPDVPGPGDLFCEQDAFVFNPNPEWFDALRFDDNPTYLLDDTGGGARIESISLAEVPFGSKLRVAVHYFGGTETAVTPVIRGRLKGVEFGPLTPATPLATRGDVWIGAELTFPDEATTGTQPPPVATALQGRTSRFGDGESYDGSVGACGP